MAGISPHLKEREQGVPGLEDPSPHGHQEDCRRSAHYDDSKDSISQCSRNSSVSFFSKLGPLDKFFYMFSMSEMVALTETQSSPYLLRSSLGQLCRGQIEGTSRTSPR